MSEYKKICTRWVVPRKFRYSMDKTKTILVCPPNGCYPRPDQSSRYKTLEEREKQVAFFCRLKNETCATALVIEMDEYMIQDAIKGCWRTDEMVVRLSPGFYSNIQQSDDSGSFEEDIDPTFSNLDQVMLDAFMQFCRNTSDLVNNTNPIKPFKGIFLDEPVHHAIRTKYDYKEMTRIQALAYYRSNWDLDALERFKIMLAASSDPMLSGRDDSSRSYRTKIYASEWYDWNSSSLIEECFAVSDVVMNDNYESLNWFDQMNLSPGFEPWHNQAYLWTDLQDYANSDPRATASGWISMDDDYHTGGGRNYDEFERLLGHARNLGWDTIGVIKIIGGCEEFFGRLHRFCEVAAKTGWGVFKDCGPDESRRYVEYCKVNRDCSECKDADWSKTQPPGFQDVDQYATEEDLIFGHFMFP